MSTNALPDMAIAIEHGLDGYRVLTSAKFDGMPENFDHVKLAGFCDEATVVPVDFLDGLKESPMKLRLMFIIANHLHMVANARASICTFGPQATVEKAARQLSEAELAKMAPTLKTLGF